MSDEMDRDIIAEEQCEAMSFFFIGFGMGCLLAVIILALAGVGGFWIAGGVATSLVSMIAGGWCSAVAPGKGGHSHE